MRGSTLEWVPTGREQAGAVPLQLGDIAGELEAEGERLGDDAVAATDGQGVPVLDGPLLHRGVEAVELLEEDVDGVHQLGRHGGVEDI